MSSIEPDDGSGERGSAKEGLGALVVSCGDASELFEFCERIHDQMPGLVHLLIISPLFFSVFLGRADGLNAGFFQRIENPFLRVISLVGQERLNAFKKIGQQGIGSFQIVSLSRCRMKTGRIAQGIVGCMYFCRQAAFAASDALFRFVPPFAPAVC